MTNKKVGDSEASTTVLAVVLVALLVIAVFGVSNLLVWLVWNGLASFITVMPHISFWQALFVTFALSIIKGLLTVTVKKE